MDLRVGIDHVEIKRIAKAMRNPKFLPRFFGEREIALLERRGLPAASVAAGFCAKEAFSKALGTGLRGFYLREVELLREENGRPFLSFCGRALDLVKKSGMRFEVSVSHNRYCAMAQVVAYGNEKKEG